ncbi:MAG: GNAT family N-acetyltransferase [Rhizobiales bacterium]|nr:GNAT family N-acetyltransferase [Hyphomicrobiales bacterium]
MSKSPKSKAARPVGPVVDPLPPGAKPDLRPLHGRWVRLDAVSVARHAQSLFNSFHGKDPDGEVWTWLAYGPFDDLDSFAHWLEDKEKSRDPWFYAIIDRKTGEAVGMASYLRADPGNGAIEIGHIWFSPALQRTREATEAIYLLIRHAFDDLGVRRLEWKCDALNQPSRNAAKRFGFVFEGIFRQHFIVKGRNRDTAWFSIIDKEWPRIRKGFETWLAEDNFDADGKQKAKLQVT